LETYISVNVFIFISIFIYNFEIIYYTIYSIYVEPCMINIVSPFLASNDITLPVDQDAKYVVKIEPHNNGPLFVEMNFYIRAARKHMSK